LFTTIKDIGEEYGVSWSFQRGATSESFNAGVTPGIIDSNKRWHKIHQAGALASFMTMREHYTDVKLT
jgi:hypothetical protein